MTRYLKPGEIPLPKPWNGRSCKFPPAHFDLLPALYKFGLNFEQLGSVFGCSTVYAKQRARMAGIDVPQKPPPPGIGENEVSGIASAMGLAVVPQYTFSSRNSIDIAIPSERLAIEVLGTRFPSPDSNLFIERIYSKKIANLDEMGWRVLWVDATASKAINSAYLTKCIALAIADKSSSYKQWLVRSDGRSYNPKCQRCRAHLEALTERPVEHIPA